MFCYMVISTKRWSISVVPVSTICHIYTYTPDIARPPHESARRRFERSFSESSSTSSIDISSLCSASSSASVSRPRLSPFILRVCSSLRSCLPRWMRPTLSPTISVSTFFLVFGCEKVKSVVSPFSFLMVSYGGNR